MTAFEQFEELNKRVRELFWTIAKELGIVRLVDWLEERI